MTTAELHDLLFDSVQGYTLSSVGRERAGEDGNPIFTYGEVTPKSMEYLMEQTQPQPGEVFYDLGSGTGKAVILAAHLAPFARCTGIELIEDLWASSMVTGERYINEVQPTLSAETHKPEVEFRHGSMFDHDTSDGDIFFIHCTCFDEPMMQRISDKLDACKSGTRVVTVSKGISSNLYERLHSTPFLLSWGEATMTFYKKK